MKVLANISIYSNYVVSYSISALLRVEVCTVARAGNAMMIEINNVFRLLSYLQISRLCRQRAYP